MSDPTDKRYKTLISGTLVQLTAFSTGGHDPHARVDSPVARDGLGRLTLRGSGLAGAFIASAARLCGDLPSCITAGAPSTQSQRRAAMEKGERRTGLPRLHESVWHFHTSHPLGDPKGPQLEVRSGVGIRQDTGAAAEGLKYEVETVPTGTRWGFLLEIDEYRDASGLALPIALHVAEEWKQVCLLGRNVARGLGWMQLADLEVLRLDPADVDHWPDAQRTPAEAIAKLKTLTGRVQNTKALAVSKTLFLPKEKAKALRHLGKGRIEIGLHQEADAVWGLDTLSLGGSEAMRPLQETALTGLTKAHPGELDPDLVLAWTRTTGSNLVPRPFIPGSGLRGPLRHALSWWHRSHYGETVQDPNTTDGRNLLAAKAKDKLNPIERLFGSGTYSGALLLSDAILDPDTFGDDAILFLEQHGEDEFTGSTYAGAKFNRLALVRGTFSFRYLIEADSAEDLADYRILLAQLQALGSLRQIPIGGANWRGHGWVRWTIDPPPEPPQTDADTASETTPQEPPK